MEIEHGDIDYLFWEKNIQYFSQKIDLKFEISVKFGEVSEICV